MTIALDAFIGAWAPYIGAMVDVPVPLVVTKHGKSKKKVQILYEQITINLFLFKLMSSRRK